MADTPADAAHSQQAASALAYVTELNDDDVLLGRGAPIVKNPGNQRFRKLILAEKERYISTSRHVVKEEIASKVYNAVLERGGRFLRKLESESERRQYNVPEGQIAWGKVSDAIAMQKVKQALREHKSGEQQTGKRKQRSPRYEVFENKLTGQPTDTPAGVRATDVKAAAVTTEAKRPLPMAAEAATPERVAYTHEQGPFFERTAPYSPSTLEATGRFPAPSIGEDYSHFRLGQPQPGQLPQYRSPFYPSLDPDRMDPYGFPNRYNVSCYGDFDVASARRQQPMYHGMLDPQIREQQMASIQTSRDRLMRPEMPQPPPSQVQPGTPFVSPARYQHPYPYGARYSPQQGQHPLDAGAYPPYHPFAPPTHDPLELSSEIRANHEYYMIRPQPPPPRPRYGYPSPHQHYRSSFPLRTDGQQETKSVDADQQRTGFEQQRFPQQHHRLSFPLISDGQQEAKFEDAGQQRSEFHQVRPRSTSSLSAADSDTIPTAKAEVEKE